MNTVQIVWQWKDAQESMEAVERFTERAQSHGIYEKSSHHEEWEVYWFVEGDLYFIFEGEKYEIQPNTVLIVPNRRLHRPIVKSPCRYRRRLIRFSEDVFLSVDGGHELRRVLESKGFILIRPQEKESPTVCALFSEVSGFLSEGSVYRDLCARMSLLRLLSIAADCHTPLQNGIRSDGRVGELLRYIDRHLEQPLDYQTLAAAFFVSEKNLYRLFKKETGFALSHYVAERRIIKAKQLLLAGCSASETARQTGFKDYSVFYRNFVAVTGHSPSSFVGEK